MPSNSKASNEHGSSSIPSGSSYRSTLKQVIKKLDKPLNIIGRLQSSSRRSSATQGTCSSHAESDLGPDGRFNAPSTARNGNLDTDTFHTPLGASPNPSPAPASLVDKNIKAERELFSTVTSMAEGRSGERATAVRQNWAHQFYSADPANLAARSEAFFGMWAMAKGVAESPDAEAELDSLADEWRELLV